MRATMSVEELERAAMNLSASERERLALKLLPSLERGLQFEAEWKDEADHRALQLRERRVEEVRGDDLFREALDRLE